jgi:hypothetical protein
MGSRYTPPEILGGPIVQSDHSWSFDVQATFQTNDATPTVIGPLSIPLLPGMVVNVRVRGAARQTDFSNVYEFDTRNSWKRLPGGASTRLGTSGGLNSSLVNSFGGPKPDILYANPVASHLADVIFIGKAATAIKWSLVYEIQVFA